MNFNDPKKFFGESDAAVRSRYFPDYSYKGVMVEVGGATPVLLSMSRHFQLNGWRCIIVEPNPKFAQQHRDAGNEIYEFACSDKEEDGVDFEVVDHYYNHLIQKVDNHSYSALKVKEGYKKRTGVKKLTIHTIKVNVRKLDTILHDIGVDKIDFLSVDTEGWELEVMGGFSLDKFQPKVVMLENFLHDAGYASHMTSHGYRLDHRMGHNYIFVRA